jgi:ubiquinone/menaquinone biosynthesis C-methylase UbiE
LELPEHDGRVLGELRELAARHPTLWQFKSLAGAHQYARLYGLVHEYVEPGAEVLDWGAGSGHFSYFLVQSGYTATGYSLAEEGLIPQLEESAEYRFVLGNSTDPVTLPFEAAMFDAVSSIGVLEHVRETGGDELGSLNEIRRVLRPGGVFICYHFPNRYSWVDAVARFLPGTGHHAYRYTRTQIETLIQHADLERVEIASYAVLPRNPLHRLPARVVDSESFARRFDAVDRALGELLPAICTNHLVVARKEGPSREP